MKRSLTIFCLMCLFSCVKKQPQSEDLTFHAAISKSTGEKTLFGQASFFENQNSKFIFIDMLHVGPEDYYRAAFGLMNKIAAKSYSKKRRTVLFFEGLKPIGDVLVEGDLNLFHPSMVTKEHQTPKSVFSVWNDRSRREKIAKILLDSGVLKRSTANAQHSVSQILKNEELLYGFSGDNETVTNPDLPASLTKKTVTQKLASQTAFYPMLDSRIEKRRGDISYFDLTDGDRALLYFSLFCGDGTLCEKSRIGKWRKSNEFIAGAIDLAAERLLLEVRDQKLWKEVQFLFSQDPDAVVLLPWGENHLKGITNLANNSGFKKNEKLNIPLATCSQVEEMRKEFKSLFSPICKPMQFGTISDKVLESLFKRWVSQ